MQPNPTPRLVAEDVAEWFACPRCHRIVRGLFCARWCSWLAELGPELMCAACVEDLRAGDPPEVWDVAIVGMRGAPLAPRRLVLA